MGDKMETSFPEMKVFKVKKARKRSKISLKLSTVTAFKCKQLKQDNPRDANHSNIGKFEGSYNDMDMLGFEDSEAFFSETHENQDSQNLKLRLANEEQQRRADLLDVDEQEKKDRNKIMKQLENKWTSHVQNFKLRVDELQKKMAAKQSKQRDELREQNTTNMNALRDRGNDELKCLMERSASDVEKITAKYQQYTDPRGDFCRNVELMNHRKKVTELRDNLENKVRELLAESEADHKKKFLKLEKHHHRRKAELELAIRKLSTQCHARHDQLRFQLVLNHENRYKKIKEDIRTCGSTFDVKAEEEPKNSPEDIIDKEKNTKYQVGGMLRQKRRKALLTRSFISTFMTVEIHNEGLNVSCRNETINNEACDSAIDEFKEPSKISNDFIPWGFVARKFLHSIVCGEIPSHDIIESRLNNHVGLQGQVKCLVADMRPSASVAKLQRQNANQGCDIAELTQRAEKTKTALSNDIQEETLCNEALKQSLRVLEKAKQKLLHLRSQTQSYLDKEGGQSKAITNENFAKLSQILTKCEGVVNTAEQEHKINTQKSALARTNRIRTTEEYKKMLGELGHAKKFQSREMDTREYNEDDSLTRFLSAFHKVASERRYEQADANKSRSDRVAKDKHNRRIIIVLRSPRISTNEAKIALRDCPDIPKDRRIESTIRAEQLLLLAQHPPCPLQKLPVVPLMDPSASVEWAEPGWHLDLEVPVKTKKKCPILQSSFFSQTFNNLHSEICSNPGRQMSSLVGTHHLRSLAIEGYEAGDQTSLSKSGETIDLLSLSEEQLANCYNFHLPSKTTTSTTSKKRKKSRGDGPKQKRSKSDSSKKK